MNRQEFTVEPGEDSIVPLRSQQTSDGVELVQTLWDEPHK